jgi:hypothetical protein
MLNDKRIRIITGHYGSGKTEFSINYAIKLSELNNKVALCDLDVVNLYFRSREKEDLLKEKGIRVIASSMRGNAVDIPAISSEVLAPIEDKSYEAVFDVGGDPVGARTLGRYNPYLKEGDYDMLMVVNANRPETMTKDKVIEYIVRIEDTSRLKVTGLINNTHMLKHTQVKDILKGYELVNEVSLATGLDIKYNVCLETLKTKLPKNLKGEIFPINLYMREEWMI